MVVNSDYNLIRKAIDFALIKHEGQLDDEGKDFFDAHCMKVFAVLSVVCPRDTNLLCAGILHDTLEDTSCTLEELETEFGKDISSLVNEVTHEGSKDYKGFYFPRLKSKRGILLKFADRLSNLSRMNAWDIARQEHYLKRSRFWKSNI